MGRDADTTAAVAGALAGATQGAAAVPAQWAAAIGPARGSCLPSMAGRHVLDLADLLVERGGSGTRESGPAERRDVPRPDGSVRRAALPCPAARVLTGDESEIGA
jgi:hypothetical protein